jgi:nitrogen fixation protein FixH
MTVEQPESEVKRFHGWRLLAVILCVVVVIALVSAVVDWLVIGPLEGRI